ncbi:MAG: glycosyltransferase [Muribaculaceae bacterium]|nr:glycosyltransferase [Muribaculaceae bacterium]
MINPKVSVLIYVLNDGIHIEKCVRSVMAQTLRELEILIIDGGSTDGTLEIVQKLQEEDSRIKIINSEAGVGVQFNTGLQAATGKYVGICESDDYILPDMYERQYTIARQYELDVLRANIIRFCEKDGKQYSFQFIMSTDQSLYDTVLYPQKDIRFLQLGVNGFWSGLYNRDFLMAHHLFMNETKGASYQDTGFSFLTQMCAGRAYIMSEAFYCYRMDNPNSSVNNPKKVDLLNREYQLLKENLKQRKCWEEYKEIYWKWRIDGYFWSYDNLSDDVKAEYLPVFYADIQEEMKAESYVGTELTGNARMLFDVCSLSFEEFQAFLRKKDILWKQAEEKINRLNGIDDVVIFGTGNIGFLVNCYLAQKGKKAAAGIDNASWKWGKVFNELLVLAPEEGVKKYPDAVYVIANALHAGEMQCQLEQMGISGERIILCNNYDLFLTRILIQNIKKDSVL